MAKRSRIDLSRVAATALETALNGEEPQRRRFGSARAVIAGAALATAARVVVSKGPAIGRLPGVPDISDLGDWVCDRFADLGLLDPEDPVDDEQAEDEDYEDEEPEDYEDDEPEDYEDDEPEETARARGRRP